MADNEEMFEQDAIDTLIKQLINIGMKVKYSLLMLPGDRQEAVSRLKQWDLWGPLFICLLFSLSIGLAANSKYSYDDFVNVFVIFWMGSVFASINCRLLGNKGSILQSVSVIGYCLIPISLMGVLVSILPHSTPIWVKLPLVLLALVWSTISCLLVMRDLVSEERKFLCAYPILLFYIFLSWYSIIA